MPRSNKVIKSCKKARLAKLSKPRKPLIPIDNNSIINSITTPLDTNSAIIPININPNLLNISIPNIQPTPQLNSKAERIKKDLIDKINNLPEKELISYSKLLINMIYKDGSHKDEILSPYLQKKAMEWILANRGKPNINPHEKDQKIRLLKRKIHNLTFKVKSLTAKLKYAQRFKAVHISRIRSTVRKKRNISNKDIKNTIIKKIKNKKTYTPEFVSLATDLSNVGQMSLASTVKCTKEMVTFLTGDSPESWLSSSNLSRWNTEVAQISIQENLPEFTNKFDSYGIMADESTRGEKKIFLICISYWSDKKQQPMLTILSMKDLDRCSASIVSSTTRIPCGLHVLHIASVTFDNITFGKINSPSGLSLHPHPFNVLNLAYHLHCGYNESNKDNPLNMKTKTINELYMTLMNYNLKRYQKPISSRWLYQLTTARQYLNNRDSHLQFSKWFVHHLTDASNVPEGYLKKWKTFHDFLQNDKLNIEIQVMVQFGEYFYEKIMFFLISKNNSTYPLPNGFRASEMPDKVEQWIDEFQIAIENPSEVFVEELLLAYEILSEDEFYNLEIRIKSGLIKALKAFKRWMDPWMHLPLSICRLGGIHGPDFAVAIVKVILNIPLLHEPTSIQKKYIDGLINDLNVGKGDSFGLFQALEDSEFQEQFLTFSQNTHVELPNYLLVYEFVKYRIWPIIVHQQHLEGMFNKYDLKIHPNMSLDLQEARLQLSGPKTLGTLLTKEKLMEIRVKRKEEKRISENGLTSLTNGEEAATKLLE
ncbi:14020_t:CDS:2, partial [Funneliformis geosporum]